MSQNPTTRTNKVKRWGKLCLGLLVLNLALLKLMSLQLSMAGPLAALTVAFATTGLAYSFIRFLVDLVMWGLESARYRKQ